VNSVRKLNSRREEELKKGRQSSTVVRAKKKGRHDRKLPRSRKTSLEKVERESHSSRGGKTFSIKAVLLIRGFQVGSKEDAEKKEVRQPQVSQGAPDRNRVKPKPSWPYKPEERGMQRHGNGGGYAFCLP